MPENLWETRALPILKVVAAHEAEHPFLDIGSLADETGIPPELIIPEVERLLGDGYLPGQLQRLASGGDPRPWFLTEARLTGKGARALEIWPRGDAILATIEELAATEPDLEKRSKLQKLGGTVKEVGVQVVSEVIVAAAQKAAGF